MPRPGGKRKKTQAEEEIWKEVKRKHGKWFKPTGDGGMVECSEGDESEEDESNEGDEGDKDNEDGEGDEGDEGDEDDEKVDPNFDPEVCRLCDHLTEAERAQPCHHKAPCTGFGARGLERQWRCGDCCGENCGCVVVDCGGNCDYCKNVPDYVPGEDCHDVWDGVNSITLMVGCRGCLRYHYDCNCSCDHCKLDGLRTVRRESDICVYASGAACDPDSHARACRGAKKTIYMWKRERELPQGPLQQGPTTQQTPPAKPQPPFGAAPPNPDPPT